MSRTTVELWTDLACNSGTAVGELTVLDGQYGEALDNTDAITITIQHDARVAVALRYVLRVTDPAGTVREYRVQAIGRTLANGSRTVKGVSPLLDLATAGLVRTVSGGLTSYEVGGRYTPTEIIDTFVLANLSADGVSWLARGTIDYTARLSLRAPISGWTRLEWLRQLANLTGGELRLRRNGSTSYLIDLLTETGSTAVAVPIALGKNLLALQEDTDDGELATAITVLGATVDGAPSTIAENAWTLGTIPGSGYWIPLTDPEGGAAPIAIDDQVNGCYLLLKDATTLAITDSRASDSSVLVASVTGLVAGDLVQIVADSSGTRLVELANPAANRLHRTETVSALGGVRNLAVNGRFATWTDATSLPGWTPALPADCKLDRYPIGTATSFSGVVCNGISAQLATSLTVRGLPANAYVYRHETVVVSGVVSSYVTATAQANGSGEATLVLANALSNASTDGATVQIAALAPIRPSALPSDTSDYIMRISGSYTQFVDSGNHVVKYISGLPYLNFAVGWTLTTVDTQPTVTYCPAIAIYDVGGSVNLATADCTALVPLAASSVHNITQSCEYLLTANKTVKARLKIGLCNGAGSLFHGARWATLWLSAISGSTVPDPITASEANAIWQRGNRALLARSLGARQIVVSLRDLSAAAGYSITREALVLGGTVSLEDLALSVRVIGVQISALDPEDVRVVLDSRPTRLITFLAERL